MESADATVAQARESIAALERDLAGLKGALDSVGSGDLGAATAEAAALDDEVKNIRDDAVEASAAVRSIDLDPATSPRAEAYAQQMREIALNAQEARIAAGQITTDTVASARAELLAQEYDQIRDALIEIAAVQSGAGVSDTQLAKTDLELAQVTAIRDRWAEVAAASNGAGPSDVQIAQAALYAAKIAEARDAQIALDVAQSDSIRDANGRIVLGVTPSGLPGETAGPAGGSGDAAAEESYLASFRRDLESRAAAAGVTGDRAGALNYLRNRGVVDAEGVLADAEGGGGLGGIRRIGTDGGFDGRDPGFGGGGLLAGLLPGGRRARPAAIFTALGVAASTGPVLAPAAVAGGAALAAGLTTLIGTAATLKLAFDGITSAAFKSQKAFDALTPVQQDFVSQLRDIQYGFLKPLESVAQQTTLPGITSGIRAAITPASTQALTSGVAAFGGAIGGGAKQLGDLFGSTQFANSLGAVIQADAGYLRDFASIISNLVDGFVHLSQAAIPLTDSLDKGVLAFSKWLDNSIKAAQASGQLASYFNKAEVALHSLGDLVGSVGDAFGAFFGDIGFQNSLGVIQTFRDAFEGIAQILNQNKTVLRDFFVGAIGSAQDILSVIRTMSSGLRPVLSTLNSIANLIGGWRVVIDAVVAALALKLIPGFLAVGPAAETATAESSILFTSISAGSEAALASVSLLRTAILGVLLLPTAYQFGKNLGQALFGSGGDNQAYLAQLAAQSALAPGQFVNAQGQIIGKDGKPTGQIVLQPGEQTSSTINTVLPPSINAAVVKAIQDHNKAALAKADAQARAYYKGQEAYASSQDDINTLQGYIQEYTPGGGTPPPLGNTRSTVLPTDLQTALDAATSNVAAGGPKSQEVTALNNAIAYINAIKKKTDADYQERTSLYNQLASLTGAGSTATPTGLGVLPPALQGTLASAQTTAAAQSPVAGTFNSQDLAAQRALHAQDIDALKNITDQIGKQTAGSKELRALEAERLALTRERNTAEKAITEELKSQKQAAASAKIDQILGTSAAGPTSPGATSLGSRERQILLEDAKRHGVETKDLINEPLSQLVKTLSADHALPASSQAALVKINDAIHESIVTGTKLTSTQSEKIQALLTQINDTLQNTLGYGSNYRVPSLKNLESQIPGFSTLPHDQKVAIEAVLAAKVGHGGTVQTGGAVGGVPLGPNGEPLTTAPGYTPTTVPGAPPLAVSHSQFGAGVTFGDVTIIIDGSKGDPKAIAAEVRNELLKTARRNATQTKGPNAGRRLGMN